MTFTSSHYISKFFQRAILLIAACFLLCNSFVYGDTVVIPATGGTNLCVGSGYVTLGDIIVREQVDNDFKDELLKEFVLTLPSSNFEFEPGIGTVAIVAGSGTSLNLLIPIVVSANSITINFTIVGDDNKIDGFVISGIRVRAIGIPDVGKILRENPASSSSADFKKNQPSDKVNHGSLISVSSPIVTLASSDADNVICAGEPVTFIATSATATSYEFFVNGVSKQNSILNQFTTSALIDGQVVSVKASANNGCSTISSGIITTIKSIPLVSLTSSDSDNKICDGDVVTFTAAPGGEANYEFFVDGVSIQNTPANSYTPTSLTNGQTVSVKVTNASNCSTTSSGITTVVNPLPSVVLTSSDGDNIICAGDAITFTATSATAVNYKFFVDGILKQNSNANKYITNSLSNGQIITVDVTTAANCSTTSSGITTVVNPLPNVVLTSSDGDNIICAGDAITFTASSATATSYEFFVDGISKQNSASNIYTTSALINGRIVRVKITNASNCSTLSSSITTSVNLAPFVVLTSSDTDNTICAGDLVTFTTFASQTIANYEFFINGISKQNGGGNTYSTATLANGDIITVEATTTANCKAIGNSITISVNDLPAVTLASSDADNIICAGDAVIFTASSATATSYEFFVDGISKQNNATNIYTTSNLANGEVVIVKITDGNGCSALSSGITIVVNPLPSVLLSESDADNIICAGDVVTFTASSVTATSYEFFVDGVSKQNSASNIYTTSNLANGQTVSVKAFDGNGCSAISSGITTVVNPLPIVNLSGSDGDNTICPGESITFTASSATATTYEFFVDGISVQNSATNIYTTSALTNGQTVSVKASTASGCNTVSSGITTIVNVLTAALTSSDGDNIICAGDVVIFTANAPTATTYEFFVDGISVQNSATNIYTTSALTNGQTVSVKASTASNCSTTSNTISTIVNPLPSVSLVSSDADNTICPGESITFTAYSATANSYEFFVDGISVQNSATNIYTTSALTNGQTVSVKASTASGCSNSSTTITIQVNPLIVTLSSNDTNNSICAGDAVTFTANSATATMFEFFVDGISVQNSATNIYTTSALTNGQTVSVKASTASGCNTVSSGITTIVNTVPVTTLSSSDGDNVICVGDIVTFTANAPTATTYEFFVDGISTQNSATNIYTTSALTNGQTVSVRATTAASCSALSSGITIVVNPLPSVLLSESDADNIICAGDVVTFTASSVTATSYEFFVDGVSKQNSASNIYTTSNLANGQTVSVKAFDGNGCSAISSGITTVVNPLPIVNLSGSDGDNTICPGESITFTASSATATTYEFFVDGISVQNSATNIYTTSALTNGQTVSVKASTASGCNTVSSGITTIVNVLTAALTSSDGDNIICAGDVVIFTANAPTATTYEFFVDGISVQNSATNIYTTSALTNGQTVSVKASTASNCSTTSNTISTIVNPLPSVSLVSSDADNTICASQQVTFTANSATATSYEFFVDGVSKQNSTSNQYITNLLTNGQTVTVMAVTAVNCSVISNVIATTVNAIPIVTLSSSDADNIICPGDNVIFTAIAPTATAYEFFVDGISLQSSTSNVYSTSALTNGQTLTVEVITASNCSATSSGITTTVNTLAITLTSSDGDNTICPGESITFTANSATATAYEFFVDGISVQSSTSNVYNTSALINGQTVSVKATVGVCSLISTGITTTVNILTVTLASSDGDNIICAGDVVTFTATSATAVNYKFFVDGISVQSSTSNVYNTSALINGQTVSVKAKSSSGCEAFNPGITTTVEVLIVNLTSSDGDNIICAGDAVTFTATSATAVNYKFFVDGVLVQNSATNVYTLTSLLNGQTVNVKVTNASNCSTTSSGITTVVNPLPSVVLTSSDGDNIICAGDAVTFTATSGTAVNYKFFVDGVLVQNSATNVYTLTSLLNGQTVNVKVTNASNCSTTSSGITTVVNPLPSVVLTSSDGDNIICAGDAVTFTATSAIATTYEFFVNGISVQNGAVNQYVSSSLINGQMVSVKVTTANNCSTTSSGITTVVNPLPSVVLTSSDGDNIICAGDAVTFTATSAIATTYEFFVNGISVQNSATNILTTSTLTNGQMVSVKVTTANNCSTTSSGITTVVNPLPSVVLTSSDGDNIICAGDAVTFTATSATAVNYKFFVDGVLVRDGAVNQYVSSSLINGQMVSVKVTTANNCSTTSSGITTVVNPLPSVVLTSSDGDNIICAGDAVTFTATSAIATTYEFFVNGISVQNSATNILTTSTLTNGQTVIVRASTASNCSTTSSGITTVVNPLPSVVLTSSDGDNIICAGDAVTFTATSATAVNYKFFVDGVLVRDGAFPTYSTTLTNGQNVTVRVTTVNNCSTTSSGITTVVNPLPSVVLTSSDGDNIICAGDAVTFTATSAIATTYEFFVNGISVQNGPYNFYNTTSLTNGQNVRVKATTASNCISNSNNITTIVNALPVVSLSSSDADHTICASEIVTFTATSLTATNYEFFLNGVLKQNSGSNKYIISSLTNGQIVTVKVTTANNCSATSSGITTIVNPVATVDAGGNQIKCANETITLQGLKGGAASSITWSGGNGGFSDVNDLNATYLPNINEIGKVVTLTLTTNDPDGLGPCTAVSDQVEITINALPTVLFSGLNTEYCLDAPIANLTGFPTGGTFSGPGILSGTSKFKPSDAGTGNHTIRYTYTDGNNCTNYIEKSVMVHPLPVVSFSGFNSLGAGGTPLYPQDAPLVYLTGVPAGGVFTGTGISGSTFSASAAGSGTYIIRYSYQDGNSCLNFQEQTVVVAPLPNVGIGAIPSPFCSKDPDFILTGTPAGGTFSGPGIITSTSIFRPSSAFIGANVIRYTYTDPVIGGTNFIEKTVIVNKVPDVTFSGLNVAYCEDAANVTLSGFPADNDGPGGVVGTFKGPGIIPGTSIFKPSSAGVGIHTITYVYTNASGCTDSTKKSVIINALPLVTFSGLEAAYCEDAPAVELTGFPVGGTFSGPGISGATFISSVAGIGTHLIKYTYTNANGCTNVQQQSVRINQLPEANFKFINTCDKDSVSFNDLTNEGLSGTIQAWEWNFGDPLSGNANTSTVKNPTHIYTAPGNYSVTLKVISQFGCIDTKIIPIIIGGIPQPDFNWVNICEGEVSEFIDQTSLSVGNINTWEWNFGDGITKIFTKASDKVMHQYTQPGKYKITLTVTTNFDCSKSIVKEIYILPTVKTYPYFENFEISSGGWIEDGTNTSWQWGKPSGQTINKAASGQNAWSTNLGTGYNANEKSFVYTPCFDFTSLQRPIISMKIWNHTQQGFDGVVLQSSIDGGLTWKNIGTIGEGINWYNQTAIVGNPGNQDIGQNGWSGTDAEWQEAKYALDALKGKSSVRFRIAFGSNADNPPDQLLNGFAFDDFFIGERDKIVLLEHFTNITNSEANEENKIINKLVSDNSEVVSIQYHTNFPGNDSFNTVNPADPSARALFYGIPQTPRTAMDGEIENKKFSEWGMPLLAKRKLAAAAFSIELTFPTSTQSLNIDAKITSKFNFNDTIFVYAAVVEKQVANPNNNTQLFRNVLRKMLPDAAGTRLIKTWLPGSSEVLNLSWDVMHVTDPAQLAVIVFVQNATTKEVYQVAMKQPDTIPTVITAIEDNYSQEQTTLYPNPASIYTRIEFKNILTQAHDWRVYDILGRLLDQGIAQKGQTYIHLNTALYPEGTYLIHISTKHKPVLYKRLVITHSK